MIDIAYHSWLGRYVPAKTETSSSFCHDIPEYLFRIGCGLFSVLLPAFVPLLASLMGLVGAIMIPIGVSLPMIIDLFVRWSDKDYGRGWWRLWLHSFIAVIGVLLTGLGVCISLNDIFHSE